jgi:nicotinic acid mononucleotide adenylyltransferase
MKYEYTYIRWDGTQDTLRKIRAVIGTTSRPLAWIVGDEKELSIENWSGVHKIEVEKTVAVKYQEINQAPPEHQIKD